MTERLVGLLGATSLLGERLIPQLVAAGYRVCAFSRATPAQGTGVVLWRQLGTASADECGDIAHWVCLAPIWVLRDHVGLLERAGARRIVALSSTSRFTKRTSSDAAETALAARLADAEQQLCTWAAGKSIETVILRPTLIYGWGRDKNISEIARFVRRFGFFPVFGPALGRRQPVHADDLAHACVAALQIPAAPNLAYNLSGAEVLSYRAMVASVFAALGRRPLLLPVPLWAFRLAVAMVRLLPRYANWSVAMAERMNQDLVFDHQEAARDLAFAPRRFVLAPEDLPCR